MTIEKTVVTIKSCGEMKKIPTFKKNCVRCGTPFIGHSPVKKFCSEKCRDLAYTKSGKREIAWRKANQIRQEKSYKKGDGKSKCLICGAYVKAPAMHSYQKHKVTAREYKEEFNIPYSKGLLPQYLKEIKREYVFENGTIDNLKKGANKRYAKGEARCLDGSRRRKQLSKTSLNKVIMNDWKN